jgi:hypothetical protein
MMRNAPEFICGTWKEERTAPLVKLALRMGFDLALTGVFSL